MRGESLHGRERYGLECGQRKYFCVRKTRLAVSRAVQLTDADGDRSVCVGGQVSIRQQFEPLEA
jgi:hypothetical protein